MKHFVQFLLISGILLQSFSSVFVIAGYELNKDYITKTYCVNKAKPILHCNGMCHLQKELKTQEKKEQSQNSSSKEKQECFQFFQFAEIFAFIDHSIADHHFPVYILSSFPEVSFSVFHPPIS